MVVLSMAVQLTPSECEALQVVSADYLEERGLRKGTHGEILNDRGRTLFEVGFARAIREVLGIEPHDRRPYWQGLHRRQQ
jgi:hypothetical protein